MQATRNIPYTPRARRRRVTAPRAESAKLPADLFWPRLYRTADVAVAVAAPLCAFLVTNLGQMPSEPAGFLALRVTVKNLLLLGLFALAWSYALKAFGLYERRRLKRVAVLRLVAACSCGSLFALLFPLTSRAGLFRYETAVLTWLIATALAVLTRLVISTLATPAALRKGPRHVLIVGSGERARRLSSELSAGACDDYHLLGFVDAADARPSSREVQGRLVGDLEGLEDFLVNNVVDEVLITLPIKSCYARVQDVIRTCERVGVEAKYLADLFRPPPAAAGYKQLESFQATSLKPAGDERAFMIKRAIDIAGAALGILTLSPLMLLIGACIKLTSAGPVLFSHERYGRNKRRFRMFKFRTMVHNAEALQQELEHRNEVSGPVFKIRDDPRVTRVGRVLRRTSLDELPQLFNVLRGEMSLVGPRPLPPRDVSRFEEGSLMRRFCVIPGLTGLWQVNGRSETSFDMINLDLEYIENWSLALDLQIMAKTVPAVIKGVGAV